MLLPTFLLVLLLALQPACLLYTKAVMGVAASQAARIAVTAEGVDDGAIRAFVLRRLSAVPDVGIFHSGGPNAWAVEVRSDAGSVVVRVSGGARPLPMLGAFAGLVGTLDSQGDVELEVEVACQGRPSWVSGEYDDWIS